MRTQLKNNVIAVATHLPAEALTHFSEKLAHETDCWDVHATQDLPDRGFVLLDVRSLEDFERGHLPGAISIPHWTITEDAVAKFPKHTLFVVYCAGPHCNGSTRAAIRLCTLGRPVKEMIGGVTGWRDEGYKMDRP